MGSLAAAAAAAFMGLLISKPIPTDTAWLPSLGATGGLEAKALTNDLLDAAAAASITRIMTTK
jgi:hypothetical protein